LSLSLKPTDTMNTAARIESNGSRNRIHASADTAQLLSDSGKSHWLRLREDKINAKGKGLMQTYWLEVQGQSTPSAHSGSTDLSEGVDDIKLAPCDESHVMPHSKVVLDDKARRLVEWNADVLASLLRRIVARRKASRQVAAVAALPTPIVQEAARKNSILGEVKEIIYLPEFDASVFKEQQDPETVTLGQTVETQLKTYVETLTTMYRPNPFHNFEHASHVTMSVIK
jgi:hypothetical protein